MARLLAALSIVLRVMFLGAVLTTALPPRLLDPQWQLQLATTLISCATLPRWAPCCRCGRFHRSATVSPEQQRRLQKVFGTNAGLSPVDLRTPMADLRQQLLARAEQASSALMQQIEAQAASQSDSLVKETLRIAISALAYAIGLAFLAGGLPRAQPMGITRGVEEETFRKLVQ